MHITQHIDIYIYIRIYTIIYHIKSLYHVTSLSIGSYLHHNAQPHWCECSHYLLSLSDLLPGCSLSRCRSFSSEEVNVGSWDVQKNLAKP